jgi:glycosyltransferase involved in cell wall biosynthesis
MKLVLAGRLAWKNDDFLQLVRAYKYKDDVIIAGYVSDEVLVNLMGSSYAFVYPSLFEGFGIPVIEAMQMKVSVLTSEKSAMQEITNEAAMYFNPEDFNDIADKMMMIYKDEDQRNALIEKGSVIATRYSWNRTADLLWNCITEAVNRNSH